MVTVLVADDEAAITAFLRDALEDEGYGVLVACDGQQAFELARTHHPALVLSDVMMPQMNGWELVRQLHADPFTAQIAVVLMSAAPPGNHVLAEHTLFIAKPFAIGEMLDIVSASLAAHH